MMAGNDHGVCGSGNAAAAAVPCSPFLPCVSLRASQELLEGEEPEDAIWVVLKWEGLAPLALYPSAQQTSGIGLGRLFGGQDGALRDRTRMLRWAGGEWFTGWFTVGSFA